MKPFKTFLKESQVLPYMYCDIGRHKRLQPVNEVAWEYSEPFTKEYDEDHDKIPVINSSAFHNHYSASSPLKKVTIPALERAHYPHLDTNPDTHKSLDRYVADSSVLNTTLLHAHKLSLDPMNPDHFRRAMESAYQSGHVSASRQGSIERHIERGIHKKFLDMHKLTTTAPELPTNFDVYTGVGARFDVRAIAKSSAGRIVLPSFTSTSLDSRTANAFAHRIDIRTGQQTKRYGEMLKISLNRGMRPGVFHGNNYDNVTGFEDEFILKPNTVVNIVGEPRLLKHHDGKVVMLHEAEIENSR